MLPHYIQTAECYATITCYACSNFYTIRCLLNTLFKSVLKATGVIVKLLKLLLFLFLWQQTVTYVD